MKSRVVITGLGVISPIGTEKESFWRNLLSGISGATTLDRLTCCTLFGQHQFGAQVVCEVAHFEPKSYGLTQEQQAMDRFIQFALAGVQQAYFDARLEEVDSAEVGVVLATAICGTQTLDKEFARVTEKGSHPIEPMGVSPYLYTAAQGNSAALAVAAQFGFQGECLTLSTGCIGGLDAISYAYESIASGEQKIIVTGASEAPITPITIASFDIINCLSHHNEEPASASRPFSASRNGFVLAEGCGILVLEELDHARARNASIYAEITGCSVTEHASHMTDMSEEGIDLARAMVNALEQANVSPSDVDFVNAHGTSTPQNDICETQAIKMALGEHAYHVPINSTKSMIGHALASASAIEAVACTLSIQHQAVHPTINYTDPDPNCDLDYVPAQARSHPIGRLLTMASGFSGLHAAMVMERFVERREGK